MVVTDRGWAKQCKQTKHLTCLLCRHMPVQTHRLDFKTRTKPTDKEDFILVIVTATKHASDCANSVWSFDEVQVQARLRCPWAHLCFYSKASSEEGAADPRAAAMIPVPLPCFKARETQALSPRATCPRPLRKDPFETSFAQGLSLKLVYSNPEVCSANIWQKQTKCPKWSQGYHHLVFFNICNPTSQPPSFWHQISPGSSNRLRFEKWLITLQAQTPDTTGEPQRCQVF